MARATRTAARLQLIARTPASQDSKHGMSTLLSRYQQCKQRSYGSKQLIVAPIPLQVTRNKGLDSDTKPFRALDKHVIAASPHLVQLMTSM